MAVVVGEETVGNCSDVDLGVGVSHEFSVNVSPVHGSMGNVEVYVNGVEESYSPIPYYGGFSWTAYSEDTYYFKLGYKGGSKTRPCEWDFIVKAQINPLMIYFDVTPGKFEPGTAVTLHALAVEAKSNDTFTAGLVFDFLEDGDENDVIGSVIVEAPNVCEVWVDWDYPDGLEAHTVTVVVHLLDGSEVKHMVEPVSLEVYEETKLLFWVERGDSSEHVFHGKLLTKNDSLPVPHMPIKAYLNDTLLDLNLETGDDGYFTFARNFNPAEEKLYYTLQVSFEGTDSKTATLNATDLMGGSYTVCQTAQFNHLPASNTTSITAEPQATQVTVPTKTPGKGFQYQFTSKNTIHA
jgi:hypothetical protein